MPEQKIFNGNATVDDTGKITCTSADIPTINAFSLGGKLTAGATEIEGSNFDINGGNLSAITVSGGLTWSATQTFAGTIFGSTIDLGSQGSLSIVSGNVNPTSKVCSEIRNVESSPDYIDTMNAGTDGQIIYIVNRSSGYTVNIRHNQNAGATNNILTGGASIATTVGSGYYGFIYNSSLDTNGAWVAIR